MHVNIEEYNVDPDGRAEDSPAPQPYVVMTIAQGRQIYGEIHLHRITDLTCRESPVVPQRKGRPATRAFEIGDRSKYYETCAQIVMDYIRRGYEITYLKLI